jgi:transposase-like protein
LGHEREPVNRLPGETGVSPATLHLWKRQALFNAGLKPGTKSIETDELVQAQRTIEELEAVKAAVALFNGEEPVSPKGGARLPKG